MGLTVGTDTYIAVADVTSWWAARLGGAAWAAASADNKEAALRMACERLERLHYAGEPTSSSQTLKWPRTDVYDFHGTALDDDTVPQFVKDAQCIEANELLLWNTRGAGHGDREELQRQGVVSLKAGGAGEVSETWDPARREDLARMALSPAAMQVLGPYLRRALGALVGAV